jgi:HD-GYP domain-containing protein (c-di-GMP phosphodiesterase class II)
MTDAAAFLAHKTAIGLIGGSDKHRAALAESLMAFYRVYVFADSEKGIEWIRTDRPTLVILDEEAKPLGGASTLEALMRLPAARRPQILALGSKADSPFLDMALRRGAGATLVKPFKHSHFLRAISALINKVVETRWRAAPMVLGAPLLKAAEVFETLSDLVGLQAILPTDDILGVGRDLVEATRQGQLMPLIEALDGHDNYLLTHSIRVAAYLALFGQTVGLKADSLVALSAAGLLLDIGKMEIPFTVLNKPGDLSADDLQVMKSHVARTLNLMARTPELPPAITLIAANHHERLDGSGYPRGLKGEALNKLARLAGVVDVYCALTDRRPYRAALDAEAALARMGEMGAALDAGLVQAFRALVLDGGRQNAAA